MGPHQSNPDSTSRKSQDLNLMGTFQLLQIRHDSSNLTPFGGSSNVPAIRAGRENPILPVTRFLTPSCSKCRSQSLVGQQVETVARESQLAKLSLR